MSIPKGKAYLPSFRMLVVSLLFCMQCISGQAQVERNDQKPVHLVAQLGHSHFISAVALSVDGKYLATAGNDQTMRLWEVETGRELRRFEGQSGLVYSVSFRTDGMLLATASIDGTVRLWDVASGRELRRFEGHFWSIGSVAFSKDGKHIVAGSGRDGTARVWEADTGREQRRFEIPLRSTLGERNVGTRTKVLSPAIVSTDGKYVVTISGEPLHEMTVVLWEVGTGRELRRFTWPYVSMNRAILSSNGQYLLTMKEGPSRDVTSRLWEMGTGHELRSFGPEVWAIAFSSDGKYLMTGSRDNSAQLLDVKTGKELRRFVGHSVPVTSGTFSADGRELVTGSLDGTARLWAAESSNELCRFEGRSGVVVSVSVSSDSKIPCNDRLCYWRIALGGREWSDTTGLRGALRGCDFSSVQERRKALGDGQS